METQAEEEGTAMTTSGLRAGKAGVAGSGSRRR